MRKTPDEFRRESVRSLFDKVLREQKIRFNPLSITASESLNDDFTTTEFSFEQLGCDEKIITVTESRAKGFVDGIFTGLYNEYVNNYPRLEKLRLVEIMVNPIMKASTNLGSDAKATVVFRLEVEKHGIAEFKHKSRSMIYSSFVAALDAFQFYINCEKTFHRIKLVVEDATTRNRGDILQDCFSDLSKLTEVNTYETTST